MTKRDIGFDYEDICGKLEIIPGFQTWFDATLVYRLNECNRRSYNSWTHRRYHQCLCLEAWHINSAHAPLNRDDGGLVPDAYLHLVRKKGR